MEIEDVHHEVQKKLSEALEIMNEACDKSDDERLDFAKISIEVVMHDIRHYLIDTKKLPSPPNQFINKRIKR